MKKFNLKKMIAYVLVAMMTLGVFSVSASAAEIDVDMDDYRAALEAALEAGIQFDEETRAEVIAIVKDAADALDIVEEGADPAKSTFVSFAENPVKIVEYDGEAQSLRGVAVKTVGYAYVADTQNLYIGVLEDGTPYQSFEEPTEVGFYYVVCMYAGDDNNYPSVGYGILVILPAEEATEAPDGDTTKPEDDTTKPEDDTTKPDGTTEPSDDKTDAPADDKTDAPADDKTDAPADDKTDAPADDKTDAPSNDKTDAPAEDKPADQADAPKTGDNSQIMVYAAATLVALGGMAVILFKKRNA